MQYAIGANIKLNKNKSRGFMKLFIIVGLVLLLGIHLGQWSTERQFTKVYEDGSFVGCFRGNPCQD